MKHTYMIFSIFILMTSGQAEIEEDLILQLKTGTQSEIDTNITSPKEGMMIYNTTDKKVYFHDDATWKRFGSIDNNIYSADGQLASNRLMDLNAHNFRMIHGNVGIGNGVPEATLDVAGSFKLDGVFYDKDGDQGTIGQVLTSTSTGTDWVDFKSETLALDSSKVGYDNYNSSFFLSGDNEAFQYEGYINENPSKREIVHDQASTASSGSIKITGTGGLYLADDFIAVNPKKQYRATGSVMQPTSNTYGGTYYIGIKSYDADKLFIQHHMVNYYGNTLTTLSQALNPGDTILHLTDASNWKNTGGYVHQKCFGVWRLRANGKYAYIGPGGKQYDELGYTREGKYGAWRDGDVNTTNNTITLHNAWTGASIPAGTKIANFYSGGTYNYYIGGLAVPNDGEWHTYTSQWYKGEGKPQNNNGSDYANAPAFRNGTAYIKVMALFNYRNDQGISANDPASYYKSTDVGYYSVVGIESSASDKGLFESSTDGSGATYSGNVGIGTSSPASKLSVVGLPSGTDDSVTPGVLAGALCITDQGNIYIDTDGTCAN